MSGGIDESKIDELKESFEKSKAEKDEHESETRKKEKTWVILAKYFLHGIAFSLIFTALAFLWIFGYFALIVLGSFIGLAIGFGILMLIIGGINCFLTSLLWFPVKTSFWSILGHGIVLFIALAVVNAIIVTVPALAFPGLVTTIVTFIISSFIDGFASKGVAGFWKEEYSEDIEYSEAEVRDF
jgi:hypothetical protein